MEHIGERIKRLRIALKKSQQQIADDVGVSRVAVTKWESGETENLKLGNLSRLKKVFSVSFDELISGDKTPYTPSAAASQFATNDAAVLAYHAPPLDEDEVELLRGYREATDEVREIMLEAAKKASQKQDFSKRSNTQ